MRPCCSGSSSAQSCSAAAAGKTMHCLLFVKFSQFNNEFRISYCTHHTINYGYCQDMTISKVMYYNVNLNFIGNVILFNFEYHMSEINILG